MASKYVDVTAIMQVIGCVYNNPQILEFEDKYTITDEDFPDEPMLEAVPLDSLKDQE